MIVDGIYSEWQLAKLSCANILQIRYATNYASASTSACVFVVCKLHTKLHFGNCSHFSEHEENVRLSISCLFQTMGTLRKKIVDVIGLEYLTKYTAVLQKCQHNVSKIAQRHKYKLPSALGGITPINWDTGCAIF